MKIEMYTTEVCPWCDIAKKYLDAKNIEYTNYNVEKDPEKAQEMLKISKQSGVPVIIIEENIIIGFDQPKIDKLLAKYKKEN